MTKTEPKPKPKVRRYRVRLTTSTWTFTDVEHAVKKAVAAIELRPMSVTFEAVDE